MTTSESMKQSTELTSRAERQELTETGRPQHENQLRGDDGLFRALVSGCHVESAAVAAGVSERTVYRRLADPEFRKRLDEARGALRESILAKLSDAAHDAIDSLHELAHDDDANIRLKASKALLDSLLSVQRQPGPCEPESVATVAPEVQQVVVCVPVSASSLTE